jgi:hypothetical protein
MIAPVSFSHESTRDADEDGIANRTKAFVSSSFEACVEIVGARQASPIVGRNQACSAPSDGSIPEKNQIQLHKSAGYMLQTKGIEFVLKESTF